MCTRNGMDTIKQEERQVLMDLLTRNELFQQQAAEALVHALVDIKDSINKVYDHVLPRIIHKQKSLTNEQLLEELWEIREQFRHIEYHINDSHITDI